MRISDVADVVDTVADPDSGAYRDGQSAIVLAMQAKGRTAAVLPEGG